MRKFLIGLFLIGFISGCTELSLTDSGSEIQPGLYTGTNNSTTTTKDITLTGTTQQTTTDSQTINIQINNNETISASGMLISVGDEGIIYIGEYPITQTITGIVFDENKILVTYTMSGEWINPENGETVTISGYGTNLYTSNSDETLNFTGTMRITATSGTEIVYVSTDGTGTLL
jgi:hypothetical protein